MSSTVLGDGDRAGRYRARAAKANTGAYWGWLDCARLVALLLVLLAASSLPVRGEGYQFVVIGDTRPRFESENFRIFERLIPKINAAKPAFVINLGDLIYGYGPLSKAKQWDQYQRVIKAIQAPYYQVPGNHDTYSREARKLYRQRFGKFYDSFDYGDGHFVLVNNCDQGKWGYIGPAELAWLKADLEKNQKPWVYVFLHCPVWEPERVAPDYHEFWAQTLHPLFRQYRVRAVFGGHFHCYGPTRVIDGIQYYITGGGGAELRPDYRKSGGVHHFVKVKVGPDNLEVRVVTDRGELSDAQADIMGGLLFADKSTSRIGLVKGSQDLKAGIRCSITLTNPFPEPLQGKATWSLDPGAFSVQPSSLSVFIPAGGTQSSTFALTSARDAVPLQSLPWLEFNLVSGRRHLRFHREVLLLRDLRAPYRTAPPVLDGRLDDWGEPLPLRLSEGSQADAQVRAAHTKDTLFLALIVPRVTAPEGDQDAFRDDLQIGLARRFNATDFSADLARLGISRTGATIEAIDRTPGHKMGTRVTDIKGAWRTDARQTVYEIMIPSHFLRLLKVGRAGSLILNLSFPMPEEEPDAQGLEEPSLNSFAYLVRYGSDALVPVHFIELILDPRP